MTIRYIVEASDHPEALVRPVPQAASESWVVQFYGPATKAFALGLADVAILAHRHVRVSRIADRSALGRVIYQASAPGFPWQEVAA